MLEVLQVVKSYGSLRAVDQVSFQAEPGEIFGLIGPNGAGKSTIIRMIMNITAPDEGRILFDGKAVTEKDKDRIGYLPEERGLYRKVTVQDMLTYLGCLKGLSRKAVEARIGPWLERFGLSSWRTRKIEELSKGMGQKIQVIASILHEPAWVLLDEPFSGLDPVSTDTLREIILELGRKGTTLLFSTHNMDLAERVCSRILLIDHGREVLSGRLEDVKARFGRNAAVLEYDGDGQFLESLPEVTHVRRFPRWVELELASDARPETLLRSVAQRLRVRRFELVAPSLHRIFVDQVGGAGALPAAETGSEGGEG
jgi:ABC-2 type transport system ATP-binding protein